MGTAIKDLLSSKKFLLMIIGFIVWFAGRYGLTLDPSTLYPPIALIVTAIFGQAIADHGKSAAQIDAAGNDRSGQINKLIATSQEMAGVIKDSNASSTPDALPSVTVKDPKVPS